MRTFIFHIVAVRNDPPSIHLRTSSNEELKLKISLFLRVVIFEQNFFHRHNRIHLNQLNFPEDIHILWTHF